MKLSRIITISLLLPLILSCAGGGGFSVSSPDKANKISFFSASDGSLYYEVTRNGKIVTGPSPAGIDFADAFFSANVKLKDLRRRSIDEQYVLPTGKTSSYTDRAEEITFHLENADKELCRIIVRAYDDGVAFRYERDTGNLTVTGESTRFTFPSTASTWIMEWRPSNENEFPERQFGSLDGEYAYPALIRSEECWLMLAEASVYRHPATRLVKARDGEDFSIGYPDEDVNFTSEGKYVGPWRVIVISDGLEGIVGTTIVENLNPPSEIEDQSWIVPGVAAFPWWGDYLANSSITTLKRYVDMASELGWEWIEFDVSLVGSPFRTSTEWETTPWLPEFVSYANSKGVKVYGWDEIAVLKDPRRRAEIFSKYRDLGIDGIKIDYIDSETKEAMQFREDALRDAAKYHLMVSFHGEVTPRGQRRTFPNTMTLEGVRGAEWYTFRHQPHPTPSHNCALPFTRNVTGPMDYTPVTFTIRDENPRTTTYSHELALAFVFESGWVCMADTPEAYLNSPGRPMLERIEAAWDETRLLDGYPGHYACLARRKGNSWYICGINGDQPRKCTLDLGFIPAGQYDVNVYCDDINDPLNGLDIMEARVVPGEGFEVEMMKGGGFCFIVDMI